ncbi:MAG: ribosome recycling factor [Deltaproteobacteria bacterium]|nr:ribosome recycling factor [Deltaproteobacteria bacterium]
MKDVIFEELRENMEKGLRTLEKSFSKVRTGRASLALLDGIKMEYYGVPTPLNQVASLSIPESRIILISPWDTSIIGSIEKAIQKSELGLMPVNDGKLIRINIPPLTEQRRKELVKVVRKMAEEGKIHLRNFRRDANDQFKSLKKDNEISEDEFFNYQDDVQKVTDKYIEKADTILSAKEKEIMEI